MIGFARLNRQTYSFGAMIKRFFDESMETDSTLVPSVRRGHSIYP